MSRVIKSNRFPAAYIDLAQKFEDGATEIVIEFETEMAAKDFRQDFYAFRAAAEKEGLTGYQQYTEAEEPIELVFPKLNNLMLKFEPPDKMRVILRDSCSFAQAIEKALVKHDTEQAGKAFVKDVR